MVIRYVYILKLKNSIEYYVFFMGTSEIKLLHLEILNKREPKCMICSI